MSDIPCPLRLSESTSAGEQVQAPEVCADRDQAERFARELFAGMTGFVNLRGIAEPADGRPAAQHWVPIDAEMPKVVGEFSDYCATSGYAAFILPHPVEAGQGGLKGILAQRVLPVDIDSGDIGAKVAAVKAMLGEPWLTVESGGMEGEQPKVHLYFRLAHDAGPEDFGRVADVRAEIAQRFGADTKVGKNPAQILRLPGSVWAKKGRRLCSLTAVSENRVVLTEVAPLLGHSDAAPYCFDFSRDRHGVSMDRVLLQPTLAEGKSEDGQTRFESAGSAIGHYVRCAREGRITLAEAWQAVKDWGQVGLIPPWPEERLRGDFDRLMKRDMEANGPMPAARPAAGEWAQFDAWDGNAFIGLPEPRRYLIDGILPLGVPGVVAAAGGLGKSYLMLDLALRIATGATTVGMDFNERLILGGNVREFGTAVLFTAEDDKTTVHERLAALDPAQQRRQEPKRLRVVPLPDAGGTRAFFVSDREGYKTTPEFELIRTWLKTLAPDLKLVVFDPLQTFVAADITAKPEAGQFVMATLGTLAAELGATVLVTHHLKKTDKPITGPEDARAAIRGTTALVDGVRWVYTLWDAANEDTGAVASGAVVKANGKSDISVHQYRRLPFGVLRQLPSTFDPSAREARLGALEAAIKAAALAGHPFTETGPNGLYDQQHRLPAPFNRQSRSQLLVIAKELQAAHRVVKGTARGSKGRSWLDVPEGDFAMGHGQLASGAGAIAA